MEASARTRVRISIVGVVTVALFSALFARLWYLQVASADEFKAEATRNTVKTLHEPGIRGRILDRNGNVLAENRVANVITVKRELDPAVQTRVLRRLSVLLGTPVKELEARLEDPRISPYTAVPVATGVPYETLAYIAEHKPEFPGVRADAVPLRVYPNGSAAFHLLGYTGEVNEDELKSPFTKARYELGEKIGKSGIEASYESDLRGQPAVIEAEIDAAGQVLSRREVRGARPGHDVRLTLDLGVQRVAEDALKQGMASAKKSRNTVEKKKFQTLNADAGAVIVLDAQTGSVVALASQPDADPNTFENGIPQSTWDWLNDPANHKPLVDRAVSGLYFPGSTFKLISAIAGLNSGLITPTTTINDTGKYAYPTDPDNVFRGEGAHGRVSLARALTVSSDVYFYDLGGRLYGLQKNDDPRGSAIQDTARTFGFGEPTGIALDNEAPGVIGDAEWTKRMHEENPKAFPFPDWLPGDNIQSAIGQKDVLVSPIQMASTYATLANGGTRFSPRLADAVYKGEEKVRDLPAIKLGTVPIPARSTLLAGFTGVVEDPKGTAAGAFAGFPAGMVAGKTGTAQVEGKQNTSWFVGMTPAAEPRYIVLAVVEEGGYGAQTAAPIVARGHRTTQWPTGSSGRRADPTGRGLIGVAIVVSERQSRRSESPLRHADPLLFAAPILLSVIGLLLVYSSTHRQLEELGLDPLGDVKRQAIAIGLGIAAMLALTAIDYRRLRELALLGYGATIVMLVAVLKFGVEVKGAQARFNLGPFQLQPAEFAKLFLVLVLAGYSRDARGGAEPSPLGGRPRNVRPADGIDHAATGPRHQHGAHGGCLHGAARRRCAGPVPGRVVPARADAGSRRRPGRRPGSVPDQPADNVRGCRIGFRGAYNQDQAQTTIGNGGLTGQGLFQGSQTNSAYVPEQHTDFIFTVVGEELGFVGGAVVLGLFGVILWRTQLAARLAHDRFGTLCCMGIMGMFLAQIFENVGMATGIMPVTGIPLPFLSYGGSSIIVSFACIGLVANVRMRRFS